MQSLKIHPLEYHRYPDLPAEAIEICNQCREAGEDAWVCKGLDGTWKVMIEPVLEISD